MRAMRDAARGVEDEVSLESIAIDDRYADPPELPHGREGQSALRRLAPIMRPYLPMLVVAICAAVVNMLLKVQIPNIAGSAIDHAIITRDRSLASYGWQMAGWCVVLGITGVVFRHFLQRASFEFEYSVRVLMFRKFSELSFPFYDTVQAGQLVSRANSDVRTVQLFLMFGPMLSLGLVSFGLALFFMLRIDVLLTIVSLLVLPVVFLVSRRYHHWMFPLSWVVTARQADIATVVEENVAGVQVVRSFAAEPNQIRVLDRAAQRLEWASVQMSNLRAKYGSVVQNLPRMGAAFLLLYGGHLAIEGQVTPGDLYRFFNYLLLMQAPFIALGFLIMQAQRAAASAGRILEVLDEEPSIVDATDALELAECAGDVELRDVHFSYVEGNTVLDGLSLHVRPGETVALVGRTGSGKSTIARVIPRFYDVDDGAVLIDGIDVRDVTMQSLRANIGLVLDDSFLFSGTVRENIAFGRPEASEDEIVAAAQAAGAEDFIDRLSHGYETVIGERGSTLSGGQRQRIAIARTLLVNPRVLILDDCTSSIDAHREHEIHEALRTLMAGRTTLIIAHRLSTISLAQRVVVLDGGRIVGDGTHEELLESVPAYLDIIHQGELVDLERELEDPA
jgi:ATP-binding cassette subfamily B protein